MDRKYETDKEYAERRNREWNEKHQRDWDAKFQASAGAAQEEHRRRHGYF